MNIKVYTDGSSKGNPGPGGWAAVIYYGGHVKELGGYGGDETTNNKMEIKSAIEALKYISNNESVFTNNFEIEIHSDSAYLINGITKWIFGWMKNGWVNKMKEEVANRELWEDLHTLTSKMKVSWSKVEGHSGVHANERCDIIANSFASKEIVDLFSGETSQYEKDVNLNAVRVSSKSGSKKSSGSKTRGGYYLSYVNHVLMKHDTWAECEKRVKGVKGAKFKKVKDIVEEESIVRGWQN